MSRIAIIDRYIFVELIPPFVINLGFFTFVFLMAEMLKITDLIVNYGVGLTIIAQILLFSIPYFLTYVIPMATMMAVLLTMLRMSADNEIVALKSGGVSVYRLVLPIFAFCLLACLLAYAMAVYGTPVGRQAIKKLTFKVFSSNLDIGLKERTFNDSFNDVMLYVNKIDIKSRALIDVFIEDKRDERMTSTVIAPRGKLLSEPDSLVFHLRLYDGTVNQVDVENRSANSVSFETYNVRLDLKKAVTAASPQKGRKEMSLAELRQFIQTHPHKDLRYYKSLMEYYKKFSIPLACLSLGILAVPLGIQSRRGGRSSGLVLGLLFFLFYYVLLSIGMVFGENGAYPPVIGMWVPDIVMGALGVFLVIRAARENPVTLERIFKRLTLRRSMQT
ncbi:MAG: LPS export ABC transporter permease LptF [Deltaproteobacteria bacterium SG8_13]|nr:MAG: LPS export ABC transporter permease LptF [Deltaproteobacteria bacterium SG8_13]